MENLNDLPQLIIGLDEDDNYIHIRDAKDKEYFCPCCKNIIKPRAYKQDIEYQVQPHFYHVNGNCNEESRIHWLYKNWLFKKGSQFYVDENLYIVDYVEIEKAYETSFGLYKPDITVHLDNGNIMFFEINFTSSKNENNYFAKWSELNIDVIEVNIKKLMNEDYNCNIPTFDLVYSDGECFKKTYSRKDDYSYIAKQKKEWERQDKINYKIMWERLDWFWLKLQEFKHDKCEIEEVLDGFKNIDISDKEICFDLIKKQSCVKSYNQEFINVINEEIKNLNIEKLIKERFGISNIEILEYNINKRSNINIKYNYISENYKKEMYEKIENRSYYFKYSKLYVLIEKIINSVKNLEKYDNRIKNFYFKTYPKIKLYMDILNNKYKDFNFIFEDFYIKELNTDTKLYLNKIYSIIEKDYKSYMILKEIKKILPSFINELNKKNKILNKINILEKNVNEKIKIIDEEYGTKTEIIFKNDMYNINEIYCNFKIRKYSKNISSYIVEDCIKSNDFTKIIKIIEKEIILRKENSIYNQNFIKSIEYFNNKFSKDSSIEIKDYSTYINEHIINCFSIKFKNYSEIFIYLSDIIKIEENYNKTYEDFFNEFKIYLFNKIKEKYDYEIIL